MKDQDIKSICLVRLSALGDATLVVPLVRTLQAAFPEAKITWLIGEGPYALLKGMDNVEFIPIKKPKSLVDYMRLRALFAKREFDVLLCLQASLRANLIYPFIRAKQKIGFDKDRSKDLHRLFVNRNIQAAHEHLLDGFLAFATALGVKEQHIEWRLPLGSEDRAWAWENLPHTGYIVINPASSKVERTWPADHYIALIRQVQTRWDLPIVLTGGPAKWEVALAKRLESSCPQVINIVGKTTPKQLAAVLGRATCMVAPDTGPAHIAVAMGIPVIGLCAVSRPELSGPYHQRDLVVNKFPQAVRRYMDRSPTEVPWNTRVHTRHAMELITVDEVMGRLAQIVN